MRGTKWVLFKEDSSNRKVYYVTDDGYSTPDITFAKTFDAAREAYAYGGQRALMWWRVRRLGQYQ